MHTSTPAVKDYVVCQRCLNRNVKYSAKLRKLSMCIHHPNNSVAKGHTICQNCLDNRTKRFIECKKKGICQSHPNRPTVRNTTMCQECLDRDITNATVRRRGLPSNPLQLNPLNLTQDYEIHHMTPFITIRVPRKWNHYCSHNIFTGKGMDKINAYIATNLGLPIGFEKMFEKILPAP